MVILVLTNRKRIEIVRENHQKNVFAFSVLSKEKLRHKQRTII